MYISGEVIAWTIVALCIILYIVGTIGLKKTSDDDEKRRRVWTAVTIGSGLAAAAGFLFIVFRYYSGSNDISVQEQAAKARQAIQKAQDTAKSLIQQSLAKIQQRQESLGPYMDVFDNDVDDNVPDQPQQQSSSSQRSQKKKQQPPAAKSPPSRRSRRLSPQKEQGWVAWTVSKALDFIPSAPVPF
jgi:hypothetical protein